MTSVLLVCGCTSADVGVICGVWDAAVVFWVAACLSIVGAINGCAVGTTGAVIDGMVIGCPATLSCSLLVLWHT